MIICIKNHLFFREQNFRKYSKLFKFYTKISINGRILWADIFCQLTHILTEMNRFFILRNLFRVIHLLIKVYCNHLICSSSCLLEGEIPENVIPKTLEVPSLSKKILNHSFDSHDVNFV